MKKLRLLRVVVQPVFVIDDGETLVEETGQPTSVPAAQWPEAPARLETERVEHERTLQEEG